MRLLKKLAVSAAIAVGAVALVPQAANAYYYDHDYKSYAELLPMNVFCYSYWSPIYYANGQIGGGYLAYVCIPA